MLLGKKILAVIPARGNSKGLPSKNIKILNGKPLIAWTINAALNSRYIDKVIVSTDSPKIAKISSKFGAEIPFIRPSYLATDSAGSIDVALHAINEMFKKEKYDIIVFLQPTSPLRNSKDIDTALQKYFRWAKKAGSLVSACATEHNPYLSFTITAIKNDSSVSKIKTFIVNNPYLMTKRRQEMPQFYRLNGAIYISDITRLKKKKKFIDKDTLVYIMPQERSIDIDTLMDFKLASCLLKKK